MDWFVTYLMGSFYLIMIGLVVTAVVILPVFGGPILLRRALKQPLRPSLRALDPDAGEVVRPVRRHIDKVAERLAEAGFQFQGYFLLADQVPGAKAVLGYLENVTTGQPALVSAIYTSPEPGVWRVGMAYLEFTTDFADGVNVSTNNSSVLGAFALAPGRVVLQEPRERDPRRLWRLHEGMVRRFGGLQRSRLRGQQPVIEYLQDRIAREVERQIETGYYFRDEEAGLYRPTWKGAILMAWKMLPPAKVVRWLFVLWRAARLRRLATEALE